MSKWEYLLYCFFICTFSKRKHSRNHYIKYHPKRPNIARLCVDPSKNLWSHVIKCSYCWMKSNEGWFLLFILYEGTRKSEINQLYTISCLWSLDDEVFGFNVSMSYAKFVQMVNRFDHLLKVRCYLSFQPLFWSNEVTYSFSFYEFHDEKQIKLYLMMPNNFYYIGTVESNQVIHFLLYLFKIFVRINFYVFDSSYFLSDLINCFVYDSLSAYSFNSRTIKRVPFPNIWVLF